MLDVNAINLKTINPKRNKYHVELKCKTVPGFSKKNKWQALSQEENPLKRNVIHYRENKARAIVAKPVVEFRGNGKGDESAFQTEFTNCSRYSGVH